MTGELVSKCSVHIARHILDLGQLLVVGLDLLLGCSSPGETNIDVLLYSVPGSGIDINLLIHLPSICGGIIRNTPMHRPVNNMLTDVDVEVEVYRG